LEVDCPSGIVVLEITPTLKAVYVIFQSLLRYFTPATKRYKTTAPGAEHILML